jgi:hypothetical protein
MSNKKLEALPDFLVIGAGKSGTTSIDKYLDQHPDIYIPRKKEPNFFGYENLQPEEPGLSGEDLRHYQNSVTNLKDYINIFSEAAPNQKKGETSNTYLYHPDAPSRIRYYVPDVKLIAILRQPADRLYSRFMHLARENRTPTKKFSDALVKTSIWWQRNDLINEGFYYRHLKRYFDSFPTSNIRVFLYEDFQQRPLEVMQEIYSFIGVDASFQPDVSLRYNESGLIRNKFLNKLYGQGGWLSRSIQNLLPSLYRKLKTNLALKKKMLALRGKNLEKKEMDPQVRKALTLEVYKEDILNLQSLLQRDLSNWLKV